MGCDEYGSDYINLGIISIHAPQWGATITPPPRWNAWNFNPRTPVGCDVGHLSGFGARQVISIHAPQWGATKRGFRRKIDAEFQSTHPSGVRLDGVAGSASPVAFQSTHPSGVRRASPRPSARMGGISIHAPQWGATLRGREASWRLIFQSTHPSGVRPAMKNAIMLQFKFQSTHPSGVRRGRCADPRLIVEFQSTHPSGVRPSFRWRVSFFYAISIHAPQWGATGQRGWNLGHSVISIHAPQWGATRARSRLAPRRLHFNPRTPVGCDAFPDRYRFGVDISIHAPQWGATRAGEGGHLVTGDISIHAPQWGATAYFCTVPEAPLFQSTHPSGVRLSSASKAHSGHDFNPRTPVGCDTSFYLYGTPEGFQSTHPSGVRPHADRREVMRGGFQSTHPSGVRHNRSDCRRDRGNISIHAPQWGATGAA